MEMETLGIHVAAELAGCPSDLLNDEHGLRALLGAGLRECGFLQLNCVSHQFHPIGVTVISIINESHVAIHTYPEARHASIDIFHCSTSSDSLFELLAFLKEGLRAQTCKVIEIFRGNRLHVIEKARSLPAQE